MNKLEKISIAILKTLQLILVLLLSLIITAVQLNNSNFKYRWSFESCDFDKEYPGGDESVIITFKKIWLLKSC